MVREKYHRARRVGVIQVKIDSSNKNNAGSALKQLKSERETSDGMGIFHVLCIIGYILCTSHL